MTDLPVEMIFIFALVIWLFCLSHRIHSLERDCSRYRADIRYLTFLVRVLSDRTGLTDEMKDSPIEDEDSD